LRSRRRTRLVRVFGPVVGAQTLLVPPRESDQLQRRAVGSEFVGDNDVRREALPLQQSPEQLHRGGLVAPRLDHDIEHFAFAVDRPPHVHAPACDRDDHLIEVPLIVRCRSPAPEVARDSRSKLQHPSTDGLVTDLQPALRRQILDITVAQGEAQVEPHRVPGSHRAESGGERTKSAASLNLIRFAATGALTCQSLMAPEMNWKQQVLTCWLKHQKTLPERYRMSLPTKSVERQVWTKNERSRRYALPEPHVNALEGIPVDAVDESVVGPLRKSGSGLEDAAQSRSSGSGRHAL